MKDLYSFHVSEEDLKKYYEVVKQAYLTTFKRLGLEKDTFITLASGGDFTKDYSHEFQTRCSEGEDIIFLVKSINLAFNREVAPSQAPKINDQEEMKPLAEVEGSGIIGVEALAKYLNIPVEKTTKTLIFETETGEVIAAAVRGGYDVNEEKLTKIVGCKQLTLARPEVVRQVTSAEVGYAGVLNLPPEVKVFFDESVGGRKNFECGANRTNYHSVNVNFGRDIPMPEKFYDFKIAKDGDLYPETGEVYEVFKAAEVGNIFPLNTKFSKAFDYNYVDETGQEKLVYMGSYGIGTSRIMGVIVEKFHDEKGIIWPENIAPFKVHLVSLNGVEEQARELYEKCLEARIEIFWDDRDESAGNKFSDADLIGIPIRLVISKKTEGKVEWKNRNSDQTEILTIADAIKKLVAT